MYRVTREFFDKNNPEVTLLPGDFVECKNKERVKELKKLNLIEEVIYYTLKEEKTKK
ncbi:MAG: hypothetical protein Q4P25_04190 [Tissierellia bacterium]|nr:hypothetical protein [Tissierellia bacterium]